MSLPEDLPQKLQVDDDRDAGASTNGGSNAADYTTTISNSSGKTFRHEHGRRYHNFADDAYFLPNDEVEAARLDLQHHTWKLTWNGALSWVPISPLTSRVLDIGTGTGVWPIELATQYPHVQVTATDLSPIQPETKPPNCEFIVANAEGEWDFQGEKFDFIHSRMLTMGMHDWERYFRQCWENLQPGGWIQTSETVFPQCRADEETPRMSPLLKWGQMCYEGALKGGVNPVASEGFTSLLEKQGFVNVETVDLQWPIGAWAKGKKNKVIGNLVRENMGKAVYAVGTMLLHKQMGLDKAEADEVCEAALKDVDEGHFYCLMRIHKAQKPANAM